MKLTVIGCSGLFPSATSAASSYLLETQDRGGRLQRVVIDLGSGALGTLQRFVSPVEVDAILLSNLEVDHCGDLAGLYILLRYGPLKGRVMPIFGPPGTLGRLKDVNGPIWRAESSSVFEVFEWADQQPITMGDLTVIPYRVNSPGSFGLRMVHDNSVISYTGDTDACPALTSLADRADLLLADATFQEEQYSAGNYHMTGRLAGAVASDASVRHLVLTHLPVWADEETVLNEAVSSYTGQVQIAKPGQVYNVP